MSALRLGSLMRRLDSCITTHLLQLIHLMHQRFDRPGESQEAMDGKNNSPIAHVSLFVSPFLLTIRECVTASLQECFRHVILYARAAYPGWSRGSWLGGALVSAQSFVASFTCLSVWRCVWLFAVFYWFFHAILMTLRWCIRHLFLQLSWPCSQCRFCGEWKEGERSEEQFKREYRVLFPRRMGRRHSSWEPMCQVR